MSDSDDLMCLSLKPGLPKVWDLRKIIRSYVQIAISRGEETKLDNLVKVFNTKLYFNFYTFFIYLNIIKLNNISIKTPASNLASSG